MRRFITAPTALLVTAIASASLAVAQEQTDIEAPVGDTQQAAPPIVRPAPPQEEALPSGTALEQSGNEAPGTVTTANKPNLPPRELTKEELDRIRQGMVDRTEGMILKPNEVGRIRDATLGSQSAAVRPTYSDDPYPTASPRVVNAAKTPMMTPPTVRLAFGLTTPVTFVDSDGYPWPVANVTYNPMMLAQDGAGCGNGSGAQASDGMRPTTINLTPCYFEVFGNINVALDKWPYPIVLLTQSGFRPETGKTPISIDMPLTVIIEGRSPLAEKVKPVSLKRAAGNGGAKYAKRPKKVVTGDDDLADYIVGRPPRGSMAVTLDGAPDLRGYITNSGDLVVVGYADVIIPERFDGRASTPDGEKAYRFKGAPYRVLFRDKSGAERPATVRY